MINDETDDVIKKCFDSLKNRYQNNLESMKGSEFVFQYFHLLFDKCHKINANCGGLYIDSSGWIKNKNISIKKTMRCNSHVKSWKNQTEINRFTNKYNWK